MLMYIFLGVIIGTVLIDNTIMAIPQPLPEVLVPGAPEPEAHPHPHPLESPSIKGLKQFEGTTVEKDPIISAGPGPKLGGSGITTTTAGLDQSHPIRIRARRWGPWTQSQYMPYGYGL